MLVQLDDVVFFDIIDINVEPKQLLCIVLIGNLSKGLWRKQNLQCKLPFCCCISWDCVRIREGVSKSVRRGNKVFFFGALNWMVLFCVVCIFLMMNCKHIYISISIHFLVPLFVCDFHDVKHVPLLVLKYL